jgi:hypothetical protein
VKQVAGLRYLGRWYYQKRDRLGSVKLVGIFTLLSPLAAVMAAWQCQVAIRVVLRRVEQFSCLTAVPRCYFALQCSEEVACYFSIISCS